MRRKKKPNKIKRVLFVFLLIILGLIISIYYNHKKKQNHIDVASLTKLPIPPGFSVLGIDVSHHNDDINWEAVKVQGVQFAYIKATEGDCHADRDYNFNYGEAKRAGIKVGSYHFFRFRTEGILQAQYFLSKIKYEIGDLPPVIDIEYSFYNKRSTVKQVKKDRLARIAQFDSLVFSKFQIHPVIYTNKECYEDLIRDNFPKNDLWICDLTAEPDFDTYPNWIIWQYSHKGEVVGIKNKVDMNVFYADKEEFDKWLE